MQGGSRLSPDVINALKATGIDPNLLKSLTANYAHRLWAAPISLSATNSPSNVLAANGGTQAATVSNPDTSGFALITHWGINSDGPFYFQVTPTDLGAGLFTAQINSETVLSFLDLPGRLPQPILLRGSDSIRIDFTNDFGAVVNNVDMTFHGYRLIPRTLC